MVRSLLLCMPDIYQDWHEFHIKGPWLGGALIAGNCQRHEVYVGDLVLKRKNVKQGIRESVDKTNPDIVGLSAMTFQYPTAVDVGKYIKQQYGIPTVLGGYHITGVRRAVEEFGETDLLEQTLSEADGAFDYLFAGESEKTFNQFLDIFEKGKTESFRKIQGLSFKHNGQWTHTPRHSAISRDFGLDSINLPKRDSRIWKDGFHFHSRKLDTMEGSRSCNFNCNFCSVRAMYPDSKFSTYSIERRIKEIKRLREMGVKSIFFTDDNPALDPNFDMFLKEIISRGFNDIFYSAMVSTLSMADFERVKLMREAGWDFVFLGVENPYSVNLKAMKKASTEKIAAKAIDNLYRAGISILAGIIVGNPDDTEETIRGTIRWFKDQPVDSIMPQFSTPYPGTPLRQEVLKDGLVVNSGGLNNEYGGWKTYNGQFAQCKTRSGLMPRQIETIAYEEMRKFAGSRTGKIIKSVLGFRGGINFVYNNKTHFWKRVRVELPQVIWENIQQRNLSSIERAKRERERKIAMNQFNI